MTARIDWPGLALLTLRDPAAAGRIIVGWKLGRDVLWTALALVALINTMIFSVSNMMLPTPSPLPAIFDNPIAFFVIIAGGLVVSVHAFYWIGLMLGGRGDLGDLLALIIWLQALRAAVQAAVLVLVFLSPAAASLLVLAAGIAAIWILVHFISVGLQFDSAWRGATVLIVASLGLLLGLSLMLSMIGVTAVGLSSNV